MKNYLVSAIILIFAICLSNRSILAQKKIPGKAFIQNSFEKTTADTTQSLIDIGNITSWVDDNGFHPAIVNGGTWNGNFPKGGNNLGVIYSEGIVWGGLVNDGQTPTLRVGGNTYNSGTTAITRIVRVRPDYKTADLTDDAANFFQVGSSQVTQAQIQQIYDQYAKDWQEWPANLGAPYEDVDKNGSYDPSVDIPGVPGASQTIFISYDDRNAADWVTPPIGLQVNETLWGYSSAGPIGNSIFKKVDLIYKGTAGSSSNSSIDSMYIVQWSDPDIGQYNDDYAGSDSTLNLGYAYNSTANDAQYSTAGMNPPAAGYVLLQGVSAYTGNSADSALFNFNWRHGYKYVNRKPLSTFVYFSTAGAWQDPQLAPQWYSMMKGYLPTFGYPNLVYFSSPTGPVGGDGTYLLPGDPVTGTGWIDGQVESAGDRRICSVTGPFTLNLGDTVEIVTAEIAEMYNGSAVNPNLLSVEKLKQSTLTISKFFNDRTAATINGPVFANINTQVNLSADIYPSDAQPSSTSWAIISKPAGSNAQLSSTQGLSTSFTTDVIGDYTVTFDANVNGITVSDARTIKAISNHAPVASITLDKTQITWGDSVLIDYSGTYDQDNDTLTYVFDGTGIFKNDKANKKAYFFPYPWDLGKVDISIKAYDAYSYDSVGTNINIDPKLDQMKINFSYIDTNWIYNSQNGLTGMPYFKGSDTLYVPLTNMLRRYIINNNNIQPVEDNTQIKINGIWTIRGSLLYAATESGITGLFGTIGKLSIYDLGNGGSTVLSGYLPGTTAIMKLIQVDSDIYLFDQSNYLYKMDFSTPSSPQITHSTQFSTNSVFYWKSDANYLYFLVRDINTFGYSLKELNRSDLTLANSSDLPFSYNLNVIFKNNTLVTYDVFSDTLALYNYDGINAPALLDKIFVPSLFADPYPSYYSIYNSYLGAGMIDNLLLIYKYSGVTVYDISDPANIKYVGAWYGGGTQMGGNVVLNKVGSNYFIMNGDPRYTSLDNPYSGLNNVTLDYLTDVKNNNSTKRIPVSYNLYQNYPNPFNPTTKIRYEIPKESFVTLKIYDVLGREVKTLVNGDKPAGSYEINFNASNLSSGIYFYTIKAGSFVQTKKLMLLK